MVLPETCPLLGGDCTGYFWPSPNTHIPWTLSVPAGRHRCWNVSKGMYIMVIRLLYLARKLIARFWLAPTALTKALLLYHRPDLIHCLPIYVCWNLVVPTVIHCIRSKGHCTIRLYNVKWALDHTRPLISYGLPYIKYAETYGSIASIPQTRAHQCLPI